jgi:cell division protein FtsB
MSGRRKLLWAAVAIAGVLAVVSVADERGFRRYFRLQRDVSNLTERNARTTEDNRAMAREIAALRSDAPALERAAREELGFVRPGELVIVLEEGR